MYVSELLAKRLQRLEGPFSRDWIADFFSFMEFIQTNPSTLQILKSIKQQKEEAHAPLIGDLKRLFHEGAICLREIQKAILRKNDVGVLIDSLLKMKVDPKKIGEPFFELESLYNEYYVAFVSLLRTFAQNEANTFISKYCILSCMKLQDVVHLNIDLTFSPYLQKCKQDIEILGGLKTGSQWGNWDVLLKWAAWSKNGISPRNDAFERNLSNLFRGLKISETVQNSGLFFLERLASIQIVVIASEICLKGLELFLDQDDQYWIIAHFSGEDSEKKEFFIKRLQREARAYALLKTLLAAESYSLIEFPTLVHTLGELEIKNDLKKVFFPSDKFAGSYVQLSKIDVAIDATAILSHFSSLQKERKRRPSFNWGYYHRSSSLVRM
jgi:hypothetical protein